MRNLKLFCGCLLAVVVLGVPCFVRASTLSYSADATQSIPLEPTDWTGNYDLIFPQFNTALGTLTSVTLELSGSMETTISVQNFSGLLGQPTVSTGTAQTESNLSVNDSGSNFAPPPMLSLVSEPYVYSFPGLPGTYSVSGPVNESAEPPTSSTSGPYTNSAVLDEFNLGPVTFPASSVTPTLLSNLSGNTGMTQTTQDALTGSVIFTYTNSVPEPSALALVGVGFAGLMGFVWRKGRRRRNA